MVGGFVSLCYFEFVAFVGKNLSSVFATFHLVLADRRATARTTTFVEPCSIQTKKKNCFSTRAGVTGHTIVVVMRVCKLVGGHQLVAGSRRQKKVDRQLSFS